MKVLFLNGAAAGAAVTPQQLAQIAPQLQISTIGSAEDAVTEIRRGGWLGLLTPPSMSEADTLALIARFRQDRVPVAIVPIVTEWRQEFFTAAVAAGADDVLLVRGGTAVHAAETLSRIKQSPHLVPAEERRLRTLYVGKDTLVWNLLEQVPFVKAERVTCASDGTLPGRGPATGPDPLRADTIVVDDQPGDAAALQVIKFVRSQAPDLPIVVLTAPNAGEAAAGVLDLGVDDCIAKSGIYRRRLIASLNRIHQRHDLVVQHASVKAREARLRQIVENLPQALAVVSADGTLLAMNAAGLPLVGAAKPADVVGRDFYALVSAEARDEVKAFLARVTAGERGRLTAAFEGPDRTRRTLELEGVVLERDARGGRGVVIVLRDPEAAAPVDAKVSAAQLQDLRAEAEARIGDLTAQVRKLAESHGAERAAWDVARAKLEDRLQELLADTEIRQALEMRLATTEAELREIEAARQQLQSDLASARAEGTLTAESHQAERASWEENRRGLEETIRDLRQALDAGSATGAELAAATAALHESIETRNQLADRLEAARDELRQAVETHLAERAAWDVLRSTLESRAQDSHAFGDLRVQLEAQLETARTEIEAARREVEASRAEAGVMRADAEAARADADRQRADAEAARADADRWRAEAERMRTEVDQWRADAERFRAEADAARGELSMTGRGLEQSRADQEREQAAHAQTRVALESARAELARLAQEQLNERDAWEAARHQLESRLEDAQSSAIARVEVEARLEAARADLRQAADTFAAERAGWEATRRQLEARLHETQAAAGARSELEAELDAQRIEARRLSDALARERNEWDAARRTFDQQLEEARRAHAVDRDAWTATHTSLSDRIAATAGAEQERARLEEALRGLEARHASYVEAQSVDRATRERERAELETLRQTVDEERARRMKLEDALQAARAEADRRIAALESDYTLSRRALEASVDDAETRAVRLAAESQAIREQLEDHLADLAASRDRLVQSRLFGHAWMTLDGRLVRCNDTFAAIFGYRDHREALGRTAGRPFPPLAGRDRFDARLAAERAVPRCETCLERLDGTPITVIESAAIVPAPARLVEAGAPAELVERIIVDMNGPSALEDRLRQARRLEEVGTLAAAMAPDIEALLASIGASGATLAAGLDPRGPERAHAESMREHATRAAELIRQLLAFSRRQVQTPAPVDLNEAVRRAEPVLTRLVGAHVEFDIRLGKAEGVAASEDDLEQLLTTLVVSGRDLLPVGGSLTVETSRIDFAQPGHESANPIGPGVVLSVTASGYGVQPVQQASAVEVIARRCGGEVRLSGDSGRRAILQVFFSRCARVEPVRPAPNRDLRGSDLPVDSWSWTPD
ncbi:MAG TPA: PAS domain S-box protein [Vicinamibacterales bacterium]|nr:PAS domain S-box protein [Vicinamibacterales bacterium]